MDGIYACNKSCIMVTKLAIITIYAGILTLFGIMFLSREINRLLSASTTKVVKPIPKPFIADVVRMSTPMAEP